MYGVAHVAVEIVLKGLRIVGNLPSLSATLVKVILHAVTVMFRHIYLGI